MFKHLIWFIIDVILLFLVLQPSIDSLCDPDTINQQLVVQLRLRQMMKRNYAYAASYEDFVSLIEDCDDLNELQQIRCLQILICIPQKNLILVFFRYNIATEIAQATALSSVKRTKGIELEQEPTSLGPNKMDLLQV